MQSPNIWIGHDHTHRHEKEKTSETRAPALVENHNSGMQALRGGGYPKQQFAQSTDFRDALLIGSPQQIIEKMLYQYELIGQQRFKAQIDFGGVPFDKIAINRELIATEIMPVIKKYAATK